MKFYARILFCALWPVLLIPLLSACSTVPDAPREPVPYDEEAFPRWSKDLRRGEIIFLGALPLGYMLTNLIYDSWMSGGASEGESLNLNDDYHTRRKLTIALSASGVIALADYVLGLFERKDEE